LYEHRQLRQALADPTVDLRTVERNKIKRRNTIPAEIIVITLGTVAAATFGVRAAVLVGTLS
jgi:predicted DNA repair protein MutK